ncbi:MAG: preprotein translocase subunit YajC [Clostridia bacterium]|nr:preprotein translocase subunit YajC [Clostridia bacterium]
MLNFSFLLDTATGTATNGNNWWTTLILIAVLILVFWLFMIRPQKKQEQKDNAMRDALAVGDEVTTIGGIIGKVVSIKGETFVLETTRDKTKIRFLKAAIRSVDVKAEDIAAAVIAEEAEKNAPKAVNADAPAEDAAAADPDTATEEKPEDK